MISPTSSVNATAVAYSGGTPPTQQPGFGAALAAKLAEFQTIGVGSSILHKHYHGDQQKAGIINQDAGNQKQQIGATGLVSGTLAA